MSYKLIHDKWGAKPVPRKTSKKNEALTERVDLSRSQKAQSVGSPVLSRRIETWHPKKTACGVKPVATVDYQYDSFISMERQIRRNRTGERFFLELPRLTGECFQIRAINTLNIMVPMDAFIMQSWSFLTNVVLIFLPPYSGVEPD